MGIEIATEIETRRDIEIEIETETGSADIAETEIENDHPLGIHNLPAVARAERGALPKHAQNLVARLALACYQLPVSNHRKSSRYGPHTDTERTKACRKERQWD
jgi:hypothetical protein